MERVYLALADNHDLLPRTIDPGVVKRSQIENRREIVGSEIVISTAGGRIGWRYTGGCAAQRGFLDLWLHPEVIQPADGGHHFRHRGRHRGVGRVGIVSLSVHLVKMDFGVERATDLRRRT